MNIKFKMFISKRPINWTLAIFVQTPDVQLDRQWPTKDYTYAQLTLNSAGPSCLNVVERDMGGTTAIDDHCSASEPTWMDFVEKCVSFFRKYPFSTDICKIILIRQKLQFWSVSNFFLFTVMLQFIIWT